MKTCSKCQITKPFSDFNLRTGPKGDGYQGYCRQCSKKHYASNFVRHRANAKATKAEYKEKARNAVASRFADGCVDCGITDFRVLEFNHVIGAKVDNINEMIRSQVAFSKLLLEMDKCVVRCSNCHRIATYERLDHTWHDKYLPL